MNNSNNKVTDNTHEMSFHDLFSSTNQISIPLFQRAYVWTEKQLNRLIEEIDIIQDGEETNRFLGAVIAVRRNSHPSEPQTFEIVDGQQRLSTLYLFVLAGACVAAKNNEEEYAKGIINTNLIIDWWSKSTNTKLLPSFADRNQFCSAFKQLINSGDLSDWLGVKTKLPENSGLDKGKYLSQFNRIKKFLQDRYTEFGFEHLKQIVTIAQTKLTFVFILLKDPATATTVFEGLNDPGIPIGIGDLVRNEIFSKIGDDPNLAHTIHRDVWLPFRERLGEHFDKYFFPYALVKDSNITNADLFRGLRKMWDSNDQPAQIIKTLELYVEPYIALCQGIFPEYYSKEVKEKVGKLYESNSPTSIYPFVLKLLKEYELKNVSEIETLECLEVIESFLIRRAIVGIEPTGLLTMFKSMWSVLDGKLNRENIKNFIDKRSTTEWPDDERLRNAIHTRNIYSSHICKYVLTEYDRGLGSDIPKNDFWIEHVMPQKLNNRWLEVISIEDHQEVYNTWGNLIPLTQKMNQEVSQSEYAIKKNHISTNSVFSSARKLTNENEQWDKSTVINRNKIIADWAINRWGK
jgi:uncharacterized protein with ParB-like and HNH nuclease domain